MQTLLCVDASFHLGLASASFFSLHVTRLTEPLLIFDMMFKFLFHPLLGFKVGLMIDLSNLKLISVLLRNPNERSVKLLDTSKLK